MKSLRQGGALFAIAFVCASFVNAIDISAQTLPSGWLSRDINAIGGSALNSGGTWTVTGSGANIWDAADGLQFAYRSLSGDFDITARLTSFDAANSWSKAGLMVRETTNRDAKNAFTMFSPGTGPAFQYRAATAGTTTRVNGAGGAAPVWLRLIRRGSTFTSYSSPDGSSWATIGSATISMSSTALVGIAVTSRDAVALATATLTSITVSQIASASATGTWAHSDIGGPAVAGSFTASSGTYTVVGSGADVWANSDQFQFGYQQVTGDVEIIARIASLTATNSYAKAGVMIRQSLTANSPHGFMLLNYRAGYGFQRRLSAGNISYHTGGSSGIAPGWIRLVREGNLFSAYESTNGSSWTLVGTDTIAMNGTVYVGLAITSHVTTATATATFTNVSVRTPTPGANQSPSVTLTAPAAGTTYTAPATMSLSASASDSDGSISRVEFYRGSTLIGSDTTSPYSAAWSSAPAGAYALTAVAFDNEGASTTSAPVNVTVNGTTNQPPTVSFMSPSAGAAFTAPANILVQAAASDADGISRVDLYQGSTLLKADSTNPYSVNWDGVPAGTYQLTATARDNAGQTRTATMTVTVNPAGNQLPTVAITAPANGAGYTAPATVSIQASASDTDGSIARVEFYRGTTLISTDTTSPYTASWTNAPAGSYALTARAYDSNGGSRTSTAVNISIGSTSNQLPTVSITSPASGASFTAPASVTIGATAADADGSIAGVDFYVGSQLIGSDSSSPYTASWTNVAAGTYSVTARARDNAGATRTSSAVSITVSATARPTTLVFNASTNHTTAVTSYVVAIYRSVDPSTASPVATRDLGKPTPVSGQISVDISTLVNPLGTGTYYAIVRAIGSGGTTASTASSTFTK